jgi:hypothetical protein
MQENKEIWSGKMQKSGKFRSAPLIFPLPYAYA